MLGSVDIEKARDHFASIERCEQHRSGFACTYDQLSGTIRHRSLALRESVQRRNRKRFLVRAKEKARTLLSGPSSFWDELA